MPEMLYLKEIQTQKRSAQILQEIKTKQYRVYCFCCGQESQTEPFATQQEAEQWATDWISEKAPWPDSENSHSDCACN